MTPNYQARPKPAKGSPEADSLEVSESAYNKLRDVSVNNPKREGYLKGFDMKINNISIMNDKISNLLDMVKIDRHKLASGSKSEHKYSPSLKEKKTNGER